NGKVEIFEIDNIFSAIGELVDYDILKKNNVEISNNLLTSQENVFISGDAFRGPNSIIQAVADGKKIAETIMKKEGVTKTNILRAEDIVFDNAKRMADVVERKGVVDYGIEVLNTDTDIETEASRCLQCNFVCNKCVEVCPNRANIRIFTNSDLFKDGNQIIHMDPLCNECGNCETFCPYDGAPYKDKFTIFWNVEDMIVNKNDGFLLIDEKNKTFRVRLNSITKDVKFDENWKTDTTFEIENFDKVAKLIETIITDYKYLLKEI
ncbi:MAG: putative selenate reductase subunit YgfK, partial [Candidatus Cloacimonadota bacterium]|nr:putative selenate reductase subunit YgfK [Candidatus Cloacimonadota bacterium]